MAPPPIPPDFPREQPLGSVTGAQPKCQARLVDGQYVTGLTAEEHFERHDACEDLAQQLAAYCIRKKEEHPDWFSDRVVDRALRGMVNKAGSGEWRLSEAKQAWIMARVRTILGWAAT